MHTYEKRFIDAQGSYEIWQLRTDGTQRKVDEDHHGYAEWLALGNVPTEIAYVAPPDPVPQPPTLVDRIAALEEAVLILL